MRKNKALNKGREKLCEYHGAERSGRKYKCKGPRQKHVYNFGAAARGRGRLIDEVKEVARGVRSTVKPWI